MLPLVLDNQQIGQRHYFDCYESAYGGLLAVNYGDYKTIRIIYCLIDSLSLRFDDNKNVSLVSRPVDINQFACEALGFCRQSYETIDQILLNKSTPFVIEFDEYFVRQNNNYGKKHFSHSSLCSEIVDKNTFQVVDPELAVTKKSGIGIESRLIEVDDTIYEHKDTIRFCILKPADNLIKLPTDFHIDLENFNLAFWLDNLENNEKPENFYYGFNAIEYFNHSLEDLSKIRNAAFEFYKWIFPVYWKRYYLQSLPDTISVKLVELLSEVIEEMEIFETNLLRLTASKSEKLHNAAKKRWAKINSLLKRYIDLEIKRVNEKY